MKSLLIIVVSLALLTGCNNTAPTQDNANLASELERVNREISTLQAENTKLKNELEDLKYGPEKLLSEAKKHYGNKDIDALSVTLNTLKDKHPGAIEIDEVIALHSELMITLAKEKEELEKETALIAEANKKRLEKATSKMRKTYDEVTENNIYVDKTTAEYVNENSFHAIISQDKDGVPTLLMRIQYSGDDWVFIDKYIFKIDDETVEITPSYGEVKRDNGYGGVWEYYTNYVTQDNRNLIESIISSKKTILRQQGSQNRSDRTITEKEKTALQNVLDAYEALGGGNPLF
ncbi:MAG: hypothetical protein P0Y55_10060 [Candidatus Cohnella colombiensis]|uniref:Lipoprotein n=1 Tax=Candidatus Cohnella colombiensis TaxID=3121368 RepID=A0AA95JET0_9BACL|nr:MAG: hypothetical protein P0Y55_10060 [Cohnella sp.]